MPQDNKSPGIDIPIDWHASDSIITRFATNIVIETHPEEFVVSFYEVRPPLLIAVDETKDVDTSSITSIRADCVGRLAITPGRMGEFLQALGSSYNKYLERQEEKGIDSDADSSR